MPSKAQPDGSVDAPVVLRCEQLAEEWHFDESLHNVKVDSLQDQCQGLRDREAKAKEQARCCNADAEKRIEQSLQAIEWEDLQRSKSLSDMRLQMEQVRDEEEDLRQDCEKQVADLEREIKAERAKREQLQKLMKDELQQTAQAKSRIEHLEDQERESLRQKDAEIRECRAKGHREVLRLHQEAEEKTRATQQQMRDQVAELQRLLDQTLKKTRDCVGGEIQQRHELQEAAQRDVSEVDRKIMQGLSNTQRQVHDMSDETLQQIQEVQARDFALERLLHEHSNDAFTTLGCSLDEKRQAGLLESEYRQRAGAAVKAFGEKFPKSTQYQLHIDKKSRSAALAASAYAVVSSRGNDSLDPAAVADSPYGTARSRLQIGDEGLSYADVFKQLEGQHE